MTAETHAEHPAALPAGAYDALHALADRWEADARSHDAHWVKHWRDRGDAHLLGTGEGRVRQWWDCATALRNALNDAVTVVHTVPLPAGLPLVNANKRMHRMRQADLTRAIREAAHLLARGSVPAMKRAHIIAEYRPPDRRRRDVHNLYPSAKAAVDGLVDAGVLPDDSDRYLIGPDMRCGDVEPGGRLVLHITELEVPDGDR